MKERDKGKGKVSLGHISQLVTLRPPSVRASQPMVPEVVFSRTRYKLASAGCALFEPLPPFITWQNLGSTWLPHQKMSWVSGYVPPSPGDHAALGITATSVSLEDKAFGP